MDGEKQETGADTRPLTERFPVRFPVGSTVVRKHGRTKGVTYTVISNGYDYVRIAEGGGDHRSQGVDPLNIELVAIPAAPPQAEAPAVEHSPDCPARRALDRLREQLKGYIECGGMAGEDTMDYREALRLVNKAIADADGGVARMSEPEFRRAGFVVDAVARLKARRDDLEGDAYAMLNKGVGFTEAMGIIQGMAAPQA